MNRKLAFGLSMVVFVILACSVATGAPPVSTEIPATVPNMEAATPQMQDQMSTFVAQTVEAQQSAATETLIPATAVPFTPTIQVTPFPLALSQWSGTFRWFGSVNPVTLVIQKVNGTSFTGAMYWTFTQCRVTERVEGEIFQDITTATEQDRWARHPDFQDGKLDGTWLRWTQTQSIGATRCYLNIAGDWWYAHITSNEHMIGIHFTNSTNTQPDRDATFDFTLTAQ